MLTIQNGYLKHKDFLLVLVLFIAFRAMTLIMYRPGGYVVDWNDYYFFKGWAQLTDYGNYPYFNFWMEHPPLFPWLVVLAYKASTLIPPWSDPNFAFSLVFGGILFPFEIGNLILVYFIGRRFLEGEILIKACWIYSSLFIPVFFWTAGFDSYPLFFLLLALFFVLRGNPILAGISTGFGFMVKIIPVLVVPAAMATLGHISGGSELLPRSANGLKTLASGVFSRKSLLYLAFLGLTVCTIALPFILVNQTMFVTSFQSMLNRSSWETVWALFDGYYGGGGVADPATRFDPSTALRQNHASSLPWIWITVGFAVLYLFIWTRRIDWRKSRSVIAFAGLTINAFLLYSKGYSPQFLVYVLPFIVLLMPNMKGTVYALLLSFINIIEYPIALIVLPDSHWLLSTTVLARTVIILILSGEFLAIATDQNVLISSRTAKLAMSGIVFLGIMIVSAGIIRDYSAEMLNKNPYKDAVDYLSARPSSTVLFTDIDAFHQFTPFIGSQHRTEIVDHANNPDDVKGNSGSVWVVYLGTDRDKALNPKLERILAESAFPDDQVWFANSRLTHYSTDDLAPNTLATRFGNNIELLTYGMSTNPKVGNALHIQMNWQAKGNITNDYQVFVHLIDGDGNLAAQKDETPVNGQRPTTTWIEGSGIIDNIAIRLPSTLPPGPYSLRIGLYEPKTGQRLVTDAGSDFVEIRNLRILPQ